MGKISDMVMCDLRYITTPEQAQAIEEISDIVLLILPKDAPAEVMGAIAAIPKNDIVTEISVSKNARISSINGCTEISESFFSGSDDNFLIINGIGIITQVNNPCSGTIILNGMLVINETVKDLIKLNFASLNGIVMYDKIDAYKFFSNEFNVDADFLKYVKNNTTLIAGNQLKIADDVTIDMMQDKGIKFIAGNKVVCRREIAGFIKSVATVGNQVEISDEHKIAE